VGGAGASCAGETSFAAPAPSRPRQTRHGGSGRVDRERIGGHARTKVGGGLPGVDSWGKLVLYPTAFRSWNEGWHGQTTPSACSRFMSWWIKPAHKDEQKIGFALSEIGSGSSKAYLRHQHGTGLYRCWEQPRGDRCECAAGRRRGTWTRHA